MTSATSGSPAVPGFADILLAESTKLRTMRSTVWALVVMMVVVPALAVFVGATESLQPDDTVLGGSLSGAVLGQLAAAVFGVLVVSGEYGSGMIRSTLVACPRRATLLAAKSLVVAVPTFVGGLVACTAAHRIGSVLLSGKGYASGDPMPALVGVALCCSAAGLLGLAVGTLLRHSAGGITAVIGLLMAPSLIGPLLGDLRRWVAGASPTAALQKLTQTSDATPDTVGSLGAWPSLWLLCGYVLVALGLATVALRRRDA